MSEVGQKRKRKKKSPLSLVETEQVESVLLPELVEVLDELAKEKKYVDVQVCPKCKSPLVKRAGSMAGGLFGDMGITPPSHECRECFWTGQIVLKASNKPTTVRDVVIMAEANKADSEIKKQKKSK
jgi:uncharacterized protein with PIN domain